MPPADPWICTACRSPIHKDGVIELIDQRSAAMPGYDPDAPEQMEALGDRGEVLHEETARLQVAAAISMLNDPGVSFAVFHLVCVPALRPKGRRYEIQTSRAGRIEQWAAWVAHLSQKGWMKRPDLLQALLFCCRGHGLTVQSDLL